MNFRTIATTTEQPGTKLLFNIGRFVDIKECYTVNKTAYLTIDLSSKTGEKETMLDLMKDSVLFPRLINMCFTWLVIVLGYYGLSLTSVSLSGDPYVNFFLVSLVELPGKLNCVAFKFKGLRRKCSSCYFLIAANCPRRFEIIIWKKLKQICCCLETGLNTILFKCV